MSKPDPNRHAPQEIDEYLAAQAPDFRDALQRMRVVIRAAAPDSAERVS